MTKFTALAPTKNKNPPTDFLKVLLKQMESEKKSLPSHADDIEPRARLNITCHLLFFLSMDNALFIYRARLG